MFVSNITYDGQLRGTTSLQDKLHEPLSDRPARIFRLINSSLFVDPTVQWWNPEKYEKLNVAHVAFISFEFQERDAQLYSYLVMRAINVNSGT